MQFPREDPGASSIVTLDIETTHYDPDEGEVVSVGLASHEQGTPAADVRYDLYHRHGQGETAIIRDALDGLGAMDPELLVSYNGKSFDLDFLRRRLHCLGVQPDRFYVPAAKHIDLFSERQQKASRRNEKWPSLEECLRAYDRTPARTLWRGDELDNVRFGDELGPAYLRAVRDEDYNTQRELRSVIEHYLTTDLEANLCLYYADIGQHFDPMHLGSEQTFPRTERDGMTLE